jgi:hypothetical protein
MKLNILVKGNPISIIVEKNIEGKQTIYSITFDDKECIKEYGTIKLFKEFIDDIEWWDNINTSFISIKADIMEAIMRSENIDNNF